jgi:hypothetical protein
MSEPRDTHPIELDVQSIYMGRLRYLAAAIAAAAIVLGVLGEINLALIVCGPALILVCLASMRLQRTERRVKHQEILEELPELSDTQRRAVFNGFERRFGRWHPEVKELKRQLDLAEDDQASLS